MNKSNKFKIVWISGMPRSGTTWLSQIFAASPAVRMKACPLFSYEFKNILNVLKLFCKLLGHSLGPKDYNPRRLINTIRRKKMARQQLTLLVIWKPSFKSEAFDKALIAFRLVSSHKLTSNGSKKSSTRSKTVL